MFKTTKSRVIFVAIFSLICILITLGLILYKNIELEEGIKNNETLDGNSNNKVKDVAGIDINGTYNQNDIRIEERTVSKNKVEIKLLQIRGLVDKLIQDNINKKIEEVAINCYKDKITDMNDILEVSVDMMNSANFSNVLSFQIFYSAKKAENEYIQGSKYINFNLNTGEEITFNDLFTSDAPIENILRNSIYYSLIPSKAQGNLSGDLVVENYGYIEDEVFEIFNLYKKGKITEFYFTPKNIYFYYGDDQNLITIEMEKWVDYIAIYNRYLSENTLYEANILGLKNLYTLSDRYGYGYYYYTNYEKGTNYFIDITIDYQDEEGNTFSQNLVQQKIKDIESQVDKVKAYADRNASKFYILNYHIYINTQMDSQLNENVTYYIETGNAYDMSTHDFEQSVEPIIREYNRAEPSGEIPTYVYNFESILNVAPQELIERYNPETGEKVVI